MTSNLRTAVRPVLLVCLAAGLLATAACKKKPRYSPSCQSAVAITAPWDALALPLESGRVCASDAKRAELQYLSGDRAGWEGKFEAALVAAGYTKSNCSSQSCTFDRADGAGERLAVQVIPTSKWVSVIVRTAGASRSATAPR